MNFEDVKNLCDEKTKYCFQTANLCNNAISVMYYLRPERYDNPKTGYILSSLMMRFYMASLQYMFNAEYCKLFQRDDGNSGKNVSSLQKLNNYHLKQLGNDFKKLHAKNEELLEQTFNSEFCGLQRSLRDSKFSHSDKSDLNNFNISPLSEDEFNQGMEHLKIAMQIINNCHVLFKNEYFVWIPNDSFTTKTFIEQYTEYQSFFFKANYGEDNL